MAILRHRKIEIGYQVYLVEIDRIVLLGERNRSIYSSSVDVKKTEF